MTKTKQVITSLLLFALHVTFPLSANNAKSEYQNDLSLLLNKANSHDYQDINQARQLAANLNAAARQSNEVLSLLIKSMEQSSQNKALAKYLLPELASNRSERVTNLAFSLIESNNTSDKLIAIELFSSRTHYTSNAKTKLINNIINLLTNNEDDQVVDSLLVSLQTLNITESYQSKMINAAQPYCSSTNESIRSNSYFVIAKYAQNSQQLKCVISALDHEVQSDKNSAMMALTKTSIKDDMIYDALKAFAENPAKSNENRHLAKQLLQSY